MKDGETVFDPSGDDKQIAGARVAFALFHGLGALAVEIKISWA